MRNGLSLLKGNRFEWICGTGGNRAVSSFHEFIPYFFSPSLSLFSLAFPWWNLFQSVESLQSCCTVSRFTVLMGQLSSPFPPFLCVLGSSLPPPSLLRLLAESIAPISPSLRRASASASGTLSARGCSGTHASQSPQSHILQIKCTLLSQGCSQKEDCVLSVSAAARVDKSVQEL